MSQDPKAPLVLGYLGLRRAVGAIGIAFPILLLVGWGNVSIQPSISDYYHTEMRDWFVGVLFAIGLFLASCRGYDFTDSLLGVLAFAFAVGVAVFPTDSTYEWLHFTCAAGLFLVLSFMSLFLFTKGAENPTPQKKMRNAVYRVCGGLMLGLIALIAVYFQFLQDTGLARLNPVFWLESFALWTFGVAWVTKGEVLRVLWKDPDPPGEPNRVDPPGG